MSMVSHLGGLETLWVRIVSGFGGIWAQAPSSWTMYEILGNFSFVVWLSLRAVSLGVQNISGITVSEIQLKTIVLTSSCQICSKNYRFATFWSCKNDHKWTKHGSVRNGWRPQNWQIALLSDSIPYVCGIKRQQHDVKHNICGVTCSNVARFFVVFCICV